MKNKRTCSFCADDDPKRRKKDNQYCAGRQVSSTTGFTSAELHGIHFLVRATWLRMCGLVSLLVLGLGALIAMITLVQSRSNLAWMLVSAYGALAWALKTMYTQMVQAQLLNSLRCIWHRAVTASTTAGGALPKARVDHELQVDEQAFTEVVEKPVSYTHLRAHET